MCTFIYFFISILGSGDAVLHKSDASSTSKLSDFDVDLDAIAATMQVGQTKGKYFS